MSFRIPIPPTPPTVTYDPSTDPNRMSVASGYGTSAIGALLTADASNYGSDSDSDSDPDGERGQYAHDSSARARLRHQVSQQGKNKSGGKDKRKSMAVPSKGLRGVQEEETPRAGGREYLQPHEGERVMSPMSDYSEMEGSRAVSGVWAARSLSLVPSPIPQPVSVPLNDITTSSDYTEDLQPPNVHNQAHAQAKGGDRRSVALRQVPAHYMRSIAGELDDGASVSTAGRISGAGAGASAPTSPAKGLSDEVLEQDQERAEDVKVQGGSGIMKRQGETGEGWGGKRVTIVDFPSPSIGGSAIQGGGRVGGDGYGYDAGYENGHGYEHRHHQARGEYGNNAHPAPAHPGASHPGPISSPHLHPLPGPPSPSHSFPGQLATSTSLPTLHIPDTQHYPSSPSHPSNAGVQGENPQGAFGQGSYSRLASSSPNLGPSAHGHGHIYDYSNSPHGFNNNLNLPHPAPITIDLPPPHSPISPMLAAPPSARMNSPRHMASATPTSMMSPSPSYPGSPAALVGSGAGAGAAGGNAFPFPGASGLPGQTSSVHSTATGNGPGPFQGNANRLSISSTNESVRGFDFLKEKNALFRGGEEDILGFNPRGPQKRMKPGRSGLGKGGAASRLMTTVDFWKRMSVMRVQGDGGKERYVLVCFCLWWELYECVRV